MVNLKVWAAALNGMPGVDRAQWAQLDPVARWLLACRASVLFMTLTAAMLGGLLAWRAGFFDPVLWLACATGLMFAHASNNLLNDYGDSRRGIDRGNYYRNQYGVHVLEDKLMSEAQFWRYFAFTAGVALALGLVLTQALTWPLLLVGASLPSVWRTMQPLRTAKPVSRPEKYPAELWPLWFSAACLRHTRHFTPLFLAGIVLDTLLGLPA